MNFKECVDKIWTIDDDEKAYQDEMKNAEQTVRAESTVSTVDGSLQYAGARRGAGEFAHWHRAYVQWRSLGTALVAPSESCSVA